MPTTYKQLYSELTGIVPKLPVFYAQRLVNRAYEEVRNSRFWSFTLAETNIIAPALTVAGSVTVTQYTNTVVGNGAAAAAWIALGLTPAPVTTQQFRIATGPLYNITAFDGVNTLTLDRLYAESSGTTQYQIYKCFYSAPSIVVSGAVVSNFLRWVSVYDPINAYPIRLSWSKADIDKRDPQRGAVGNPYVLAYYKDDPNGVPMYELWPNPQAANGYTAFYQTIGTPLAADTDTLPFSVIEDVVASRARYLSYRWAEAAKGSHPELQESNWAALWADEAQYYDKRLMQAQRQDEEIFNTNFQRWWPWAGGIGPNTGLFWQSHGWDAFGSIG